MTETLERPAAVSVLVPSRWLRLRFWVLGLRLPEPYRPWAAQQITDPHYLRRRSVGMLGLLVFWVPALALLTAGDGSVVVLAGPVGLLLGALLQSRRHVDGVAARRWCSATRGSPPTVGWSLR